MRVMRVPFLFIYKLSKMQAKEFERLQLVQDLLEQIGYNGMPLTAKVVIEILNTIDETMPRWYCDIDYWKDMPKKEEV